MTVHKLTAGDGYTYLTRQVAGGDVKRERGQSAAEYYTAAGNPSGRWAGSGCAALGVWGPVSQAQMEALFGQGMHPDAEAMMAAFLSEHVRAGMSQRELEDARERARRAVLLGRPFPRYEDLDPFDERVARRLAVIEAETGRAATRAEANRVAREEARRQRKAVAGFDLVFSPVKSVSLLWALDERAWVRQAIWEAHGAARDATLAMLERHAAFTRTGSVGQAQIDTHGLIAAVFDHADSRLGDPDLHTHVAVSSKVLGIDGRWRALDARGLYRIAVAASERYNTLLETELIRRLGVSFVERLDTVSGREPVREIAGIPAEVIEFFSARRREIEARYGELVAAYRRKHGRDPSLAAAHELAQQATLDTRKGKKPPRSWERMRQEWRAALVERFGEQALAQVMTAVPDELPTPGDAVDVDVAVLAARVLWAVQDRRATWTRWNVLAEAERVIRACNLGARTDHDQLAQRVVEDVLNRRCLLIQAPELVEEPPVLRRRDGSSVFVEHGCQRYTSQAMLDAEQRLLNAARAPAVTVVNPRKAARLLADYERRSGRRLDEGQRALVAAFASDARRLVVGIGPAGSGKTTAMRALRHVTEAAGGRLVALATSANAAAVLGADVGVGAENLHKFLHEHTAGPYAQALAAGTPVPADKELFGLGAGDVVVVDEAGMAGTLNLDRLVSIATQRGAVVRLLGDYRQLGAVESGGVLRLIAQDVGAVELSRLYRFAGPDEAAATLKIRVGDASGLDFYQRADRIRHGSRQAMIEAAYAGWRADMLAGRTTLMAAATTADVSRLSARARAERVAAGQVEPDGVLLPDGNRAGVGDWIVTRHNNRLLASCGGRDWVKNGDAWRVVARTREGALRVRRLNDRAAVTLPADYVRRYVELLYATTTHRAQGATVDTAHPLITGEMGRENFYVLISRARYATTLYVATHELGPLDIDEHVDQARLQAGALVAREVLENIVAHQRAQPSATQILRDSLAEAESLATLVPRYTHALDVATRDHYQRVVTDVLPRQATALLDDGAWPALMRALRRAESAGWDPAALLRQAAQQRETATADSLAQVLTWRIATIVDHQQPPPPTATPSPQDAARYHRMLTALAPELAGGIDPGLDLGDESSRPGDRISTGGLTAIVASVLGPHDAARARREPAWPALLAALWRAEQHGHQPAHLLAEVTRQRELRSARQLCEVLAWRINTRVRSYAPVSPRGNTQAIWCELARTLKAAETDENDPRDLLTRALEVERDVGGAGGLRAVLTHLRQAVARARYDAAQSSGLPPWLAGKLSAGPVIDPVWRDYLATRQRLIRRRVTELAETVVTQRPAWSRPLGEPPPGGPEARAAWLHQLGIVAAYRDQYRVTDDEPEHPLGPYIESGYAGHTAYWHAAQAALTAHTIATTGTQSIPGDPSAQALGDVAADLYTNLPEQRQHAMGERLARRLGMLWFGNPNNPGVDVTQPAYRARLADMLAADGLLSAAGAQGPKRARRKIVHGERARVPSVVPSPHPTPRRGPRPGPR